MYASNLWGPLSNAIIFHVLYDTQSRCVILSWITTNFMTSTWILHLYSHFIIFSCLRHSNIYFQYLNGFKRNAKCKQCRKSLNSYLLESTIVRQSIEYAMKVQMRLKFLISRFNRVEYAEYYNKFEKCVNSLNCFPISLSNPIQLQKCEIN